MKKFTDYAQTSFNNLLDSLKNLVGCMHASRYYSEQKRSIVMYDAEFRHAFIRSISGVLAGIVGLEAIPAAMTQFSNISHSSQVIATLVTASAAAVTVWKASNWVMENRFDHYWSKNLDKTNLMLSMFASMKYAKSSFTLADVRPDSRDQPIIEDMRSNLVSASSMQYIVETAVIILDGLSDTSSKRKIIKDNVTSAIEESVDFFDKAYKALERVDDNFVADKYRILVEDTIAYQEQYVDQQPDPVGALSDILRIKKEGIHDCNVKYAEKRLFVVLHNLDIINRLVPVLTSSTDESCEVYLTNRKMRGTYGEVASQIIILAYHIEDAYAMGGADIRNSDYALELRTKLAQLDDVSRGTSMHKVVDELFEKIERVCITREDHTVKSVEYMLYKKEEYANSWDAYYFAKKHPDCDITDIQNMVLSDSDKLVAAYFAKDIAGADVDALQQSVLRDGSGEAAYHFAKWIDGADVAALQNVVIQRGTSIDAYHFAKDIKDADILSLQNVLIDTGDGEDAYKFAKDITGANIPALQDVVVQRGDAHFIRLFAEEVLDSDIEKLQTALLKCDDARELFKFSVANESADVSAIYNRIQEIAQQKDIRGDQARSCLDRMHSNATIQNKLMRQTAKGSSSSTPKAG